MRVVYQLSFCKYDCSLPSIGNKATTPTLIRFTPNNCQQTRHSHSYQIPKQHPYNSHTTATLTDT